MNKIRVVIDSSRRTIFEGCCPLYKELGRMIDLSGEKNVSNGR
jgi:hypothetical protein